MPADRYRTLTNRTTSEFKDRGSKFIGFSFPVGSKDDVKASFDVVRELHPTSRHVCYAYILGELGQEYRANDDGEPNGSAGLPILNQIKSFELTFTLVAVVRYFGGTKLGVSGLINAYKEAAKLSLEAAEIVEETPKSFIKISFAHSSTGEVEKLIRQTNLEVPEMDFGIKCNWLLKAERASTQEILSLLKRINNLDIISVTD